MNILNSNRVSSKLDLEHISTEINLTEEQFSDLHMSSFTYDEFTALKDLRNLDYDSFISRFQIYSSYKEAKNKVDKENKGKYLEVHHIEDVAIQLKRFNESHNTSYDRDFFRKNCEEYFDDRVIIVSSFEHVLCHYLSIFKGKEYKANFYSFISFTSFENTGNILDILIKISQDRKTLIDKNKEAIAKIPLEEKLSTSERHSRTNKENYAKLSEEEKQRRRDNTRKALNQPEVRKKLSECSKGQYVWNNGTIEIKCRKCPGPDFVRGVLPEHKMRSSVNTGKTFYTNGISNILLYPNDPIPEGYYKGIVKKKSSKVIGPKNKTLYNNGIESKYFSEDENIPEGFILGGLSRGNIYNNGKEIKLFKEDETIPEGWVKGDLPHKPTNKIWYTDGVNNLSLYSNETPPPGYYKGRSNMPKNTGKIKYNDGQKEYFLSPEDKVPEGWVKGKLKKDHPKEGTYYNNGTTTKLFLKNEIIPEGWKKGILRKDLTGKKLYTNGLENKYFTPGEEPENWVKVRK